VLDLLSRHKGEVVALLRPGRNGWSAEDWRAFFDERAGIGLEDRKGRPARLVLGEALPDNREILPTPEQLVQDAGLRSCAVDRGDRPSPPPSGADQEVISFEAQPPASTTNFPWEQRL
jgi:hypothetical protein